MASINQQPTTNQVASRIDHDIELVKTTISHIEVMNCRIIQHARSLGYYEPTPAASAVAPTPVITTLADALQALGRAVENCSGSLAVFD